MDEVTIRRAVMADLEAVGALLQEVDDLHRGALPWLLRPVDGPPSTDFLEAYVSKDDHAMFLAVAPEGFLAGVLYMFLRQPARASIVAPTVLPRLTCSSSMALTVVNTSGHVWYRLRSSGRAYPVRRVPNWGSTSSTSRLAPVGLRSASKRCPVASSYTPAHLKR